MVTSPQATRTPPKRKPAADAMQVTVLLKRALVERLDEVAGTIGVQPDRLRRDGRSPLHRDRPMSDGPRLPAFSHLDGVQCVVWCEKCDKWHSHGDGPGHRIAHCHDDERRPHGYTLFMCGPMTKPMLQQYRKQRGSILA